MPRHRLQRGVDFQRAEGGAVLKKELGLAIANHIGRATKGPPGIRDPNPNPGCSHSTGVHLKSAE
jgi:hypothetical protein